MRLPGDVINMAYNWIIKAHTSASKHTISRKYVLVIYDCFHVLSFRYSLHFPFTYTPSSVFVCAPNSLALSLQRYVSEAVSS